MGVKGNRTGLEIMNTLISKTANGQLQVILERCQNRQQYPHMGNSRVAGECQSQCNKLSTCCHQISMVWLRISDYSDFRSTPCPKQCPPSYFLITLSKINRFILNFGMLNPEKIWHEYITDLPTSPVRCSHFTLGSPKNHFSTLLLIYFRSFMLFGKKTNSNCCTATLAVYLLLFSACFYLHSQSTASGARYRIIILALISQNLSGHMTWMHLTRPTCIWHPRRGWPRSNFDEIFGFRKLESLGYGVALLLFSYLSHHFSRTPTCDRHIQTQTDTGP